ncbi:MAG TPA: hypothetical protein VHX37_05700 [Acidobacteriaceae bacterium]|jgi:hypothetical protein|nr:hypothetical protein [Acidobacteriaceae bacterium]
MKKLVYASVALVGICCGWILCTPALAQANGQANGQSSSCAGQTIKDAAEYNAYANAMSQSAPAAKAEAIEAFLQQYPNSVAKQQMIEQLMLAYQQSNNAPKLLDAAKRLSEVDAGNLRALLTIAYLDTTQANGNQQMLDDAAAAAQKGLSAPKDQCMSQADYDKIKDTATPIFYRAMALDSQAKKDYQGEIDAYTKELQSYKDPAATTQVPALLDTYYLGQAYLQKDSKDPASLKSAIWFLTRAAQFAKPPYQGQIETAAEYWYRKFHCSQTDAPCMTGNPPPGFAAIQQLAAVPANVFPPADYNPTQAPPPPSPADLAHQAIVTLTGCANATPAPPPAPAAGSAPGATPAPAPASAPAAAPTTPLPPACSDSLKNSLALSDKEFILANGTQEDQSAVWSVMNGVTAEVPGVVVSATPDTVQLAVSQDAQQSNKADFTINMKTPLKTADVPKQGDKVTYIATFDSYTQNPPMIIMKDGTTKPKAPEHHAPVHHTTTHHPGR